MPLINLVISVNNLVCFYFFCLFVFLIFLFSVLTFSFIFLLPWENVFFLHKSIFCENSNIIKTSIFNFFFRHIYFKYLNELNLIWNWPILSPIQNWPMLALSEISQVFIVFKSYCVNYLYCIFLALWWIIQALPLWNLIYQIKWEKNWINTWSKPFSK